MFARFFPLFPSSRWSRWLWWFCGHGCESCVDHLLTTPLLPDVPQVQCPVQRCHVNMWPVSTLETGLATVMTASKMAKSFKIWDIWQVTAMRCWLQVPDVPTLCYSRHDAWDQADSRESCTLRSLFWDQAVALHQISHAETQAPWATLSVGTTIISVTKDLYLWHLYRLVLTKSHGTPGHPYISHLL